MAYKTDIHTWEALLDVVVSQCVWQWGLGQTRYRIDDRNNKISS